MAKPPKQKPLSNVQPEDVLAAEAFLVEHETKQMRLNAIKSAGINRFTNLGVSMPALASIMKLKKLDRPELKERIETEARYMRITGLVEWDDKGQASLLKALTEKPAAPEPSGALSLSRAFNDGYNTGRHKGLRENCPFNAGTEEYVKWQDGWNDGRDDLLLVNPDADKEKKASTRRERKPKVSDFDADKANGKPRGRKPTAGDDMGAAAGSA